MMMAHDTSMIRQRLKVMLASSGKLQGQVGIAHKKKSCDVYFMICTCYALLYYLPWSGVGLPDDYKTATLKQACGLGPGHATWEKRLSLQ